jgi:hypothetical protein
MSVLILVLALSQSASPDLVTVAQGLRSGESEPLECVVRTAAEWEALWKSHAGVPADLPAKPGAEPAPAVDWPTEMVVAVFLGTRSTGGYSVEIAGARREGDALIVEYVERQPGPGSIVTQALTSPFHIAKLPRHDGPVRFEKLTTPEAR